MLEVKVQQWRVAAIYMGAVIGAGFASGQEIMQFFVGYDQAGLGSIFLATGILAIFGALAVRISTVNSVRNYEQYFALIFGRRLGKMFDLIISLSLFLGLGTMLAGTTAVFKEYLGIPIIYALLINSSTLFLTLLGGEKGISWLNAILIPILLAITGSVIMSSFLVAEQTPASVLHIKAPKFAFNWLISGVLYGSYNLVLGTVVLSSIESRDEKGPVWASVIMGLMICGMFLVLGRHYFKLENLEIPMLFLAGLKYGWLRLLYVFVLWFAMLTTAAANAFSLANRGSRTAGKGYIRELLLIILASIPVSLLGFSSMIEHFYPLFGVIGFPLIVGMLIYELRGQKKLI